MEYVTLERSVYDTMVATLAECRSALRNALRRLSGNERQEWIDNPLAQQILRRSGRSLAGLRLEGKIGYSIIEGKVYYPSQEIGRYIHSNKIVADGTRFSVGKE